MALASVVSTPVLPLADAYALRGLAERRRAYGPVRLWGSVSFIAANFGGGLVLELAGAGNLIWALVASQVLAAAAALWLLPLTPERSSSPVPTGRPAKSLWRMPVFLCVVAAASLIQSSHAVMHGFGTLQWAARGLEGPAIGMLWGLGVVAEIGLFAVSGRLVPAFGGIAMIALGGLGAFVRWGAMAVDPPTALLPALQCLHALSFGATHLGAMHVLARLAPHGQGATAQGDFAAVQGITFAAAMGASGLLVEAYGTFAYAAMALMAAAGTLSAFAALRFARQPAPGTIRQQRRRNSRSSSKFCSDEELRRGCPAFAGHDEFIIKRSGTERRVTGRSDTSRRVRARSGRSCGASDRRVP